MLGDLSIYDGRIVFTAKDAEFRTKFIEIGKRIIGKEPLFINHKASWVEIRFYSPTFLRELQTWLNLNETSLGGVFGARSYKPDHRAFLKIYDFIQKTRENAKAFIEGFYDSEGSLDQRKRTKVLKSGEKLSSYYQEWRIELYNTNQDVLQFIQTLLSNFFDIESKLRLKRPKGFVNLFPNSENPAKYSKDYWRLCIRKQTNIKEFARSFHSSIPRKNLRLENSS
jgi:intein/homing endonuclease